MNWVDIRKILINHVTPSKDRCYISKEDFNKVFTKTNKTVRFTFAGWDGKSYGNEARNSKIWKCNLPGLEDIDFIKVGKGIHYVMYDYMRTEQLTGIDHPDVGWVTYVANDNSGWRFK